MGGGDQLLWAGFSVGGLSPARPTHRQGPGRAGRQCGSPRSGWQVAFPIHVARTELDEAMRVTITAMLADGTYAEIYERNYDNDDLRVDLP